MFCKIEMIAPNIFSLCNMAQKSYALHTTNLADEKHAIRGRRKKKRLLTEHSLASWPTNSGKVSRTRRHKIGMGVGWFSLVGAVRTYCRRIVRASWMDDWRTTLTCLVPPSTTPTEYRDGPGVQRPTGELGQFFVVPLLVTIAREATQVMGSRLSTPPHQPL